MPWAGFGFSSSTNRVGLRRPLVRILLSSTAPGSGFSADTTTTPSLGSGRRADGTMAVSGSGAGSGAAVPCETEPRTLLTATCESGA